MKNTKFYRSLTLASITGALLLLAGCQVATSSGNNNLTHPQITATASATPAVQTNLDAATNTLEQQQAYADTLISDLNVFWSEQAKKEGFTFTPPAVKVFTGTVTDSTGYQFTQADTSYNPVDNTLYIASSFFATAKADTGVNDNSGITFVIAHEYGHAVQGMQKTMTDKYNSLYDESQKTGDTTAFDSFSQRYELQADYYSGMFFKYLADNGKATPANEASATAEASADGIDRIQAKNPGSYVAPDHGTSTERSVWFSRGYTYGDLEHGDTYTVSDLGNP